MSRLVALILFGILTFAVVNAGRLVQEDPLWNKDETPNEPMVMVPDAPDDDFWGDGRLYSRQKKQEKVATSTTPTPSTEKSSTDATLDTKLIETTTPTSARPRKKESFKTSQASTTKRSRRREPKAEIGTNHKLMAPVSTNTVEGEDTKVNNRRFAISKELDERIMEEEGDNDDDSVTRGKRQIAVWTPLPHILPLEEFFFEFNLTTPKYPYGKCFVSYGFEKNPSCLGGEVCVDKDSGIQIECSLPGGPPPPVCPPCSAGPSPPGPSPPGPQPPPPPPPPPPTGNNTGPPVTACPRGCQPGPGCAPLTGEEDGVCSDPVRPTEEYDYAYELSSTHRTPQVYYSGIVPYGDPCSVYGDLIDENQRSDLEFILKSRKLKANSETGNLGSNMCNWSKARLQCIPNKPRISTTTPAGAPPPTEQDIEGSKRPAGTCKCMISLGSLAVVAQEKDSLRKICYIPANKGAHSTCDHEIIMPPYGALEGLRRDGSPIHRGLESASKFCVPNAECRAGYKYTGLRCMCRKRARWDPKELTCAKTTRITDLQMAGESNLIFVLGVIYLVNLM